LKTPGPKKLDGGMAPPVASSISSVALSDLAEGSGAVRLRNEAACQEMEHSLRRQGQLTAVIARRSGAGVEVVDGLKRLQAARRLGWRELRAEVREMDLVQAMVLVFQVNAGSHLVDVEQAWVVRSLYRDGHLSQPQIAQLLGRHKSWVCRRLMLAEGLAEGVEANLRLGLLSATAAREVARLPRGNQDPVAELIARRGLTTRQAAKLVDKLLTAPDETARRFILGDVEALASLTIKTSANGRARTAATRSPGERLVTDTLAMDRLAVRLHVQLLAQPLRALGTPAADIAARSLSELRAGLVSLCRTIDKVVGEAGVGDVEIQ
jgi:ParB-like chromosome segregation protein Spo0J